MGYLTPYHQRPLIGRAEARQLGRTLGALEASVRLETARIEAIGEVQAVRADVVTYVGKRSLQNVALMTQLEQQLATLVPLAAGRLQAIADLTALAVAEVVSDTQRQVR